ncbi:cyclic nucleotide-binding domain-containing protein [Candidatus Peregrinibacteria bacterium]|nr:cyclic nucleotide-binding domain-containing protein [Candidatus Peregrinibacteria bacterium]
MPTQTIQSKGLMNINDILDITHEEKYETGGFIFKEGEEDKNFYLVMNGEIEIAKKTSDGKEKVIAELKPGEILGEGVLSGIFIKPTTARAVTDVTLLTFSKEDFDNLLKENSQAGVEFLLSVIGTVNDRLNTSNIMLLSLFEINKLMSIYRDDINTLSKALIDKLILITKSNHGVFMLKNPFEENYRIVYSTSPDLTTESFKDYDKTKSQIIKNTNHQYIFVDLKGVGFIALLRDNTDHLYEDEDLRLMILIADQAGNVIESASRRASDKARDVLHQRKIVL